VIAGLYAHRDSPIHRLPAGAKLAALPIAGTLVFAVPSLALATGVLALTLLGYVAARLGPRMAWAQLRPVLFVLALIAAAQLWFGTPFDAALAALRLAALILLAALMTLTTRTADLVTVLERVLSPLRPLGVDPARVSLAISLTLRFIPMVAQIVEEVREAQAARGVRRSTLRLAVPVIVRLLKAGDEIAEAIDARS
jgi:biotin transport system permease protein